MCTVNHAKGGEVRVDAKCSYAGDTTIAEIQFDLETSWAEAGFRAYTPQVKVRVRVRVRVSRLRLAAG